MPDYLRQGEIESMVLYSELNADLLLIDDRRAREYAESLGIKCTGKIGILIASKERQLVSELRPLFISLLNAKRYYSLDFLNRILSVNSESQIS